MARCRGLRGNSGQALIETAVVFAFLAMPILAGTAQIGLFVYYSIEVTNSATAGAMYGMQSSAFAEPSNYPSLIAAARADAPDFSGVSLTVTPTTYWACSTDVAGTQYATKPQADAACTGGTNHTLPFIKVVTSATVTPIIHCPGLPSSFPLSGSSVQEVLP
jgi:hypothetical protein